MQIALSDDAVCAVRPGHGGTAAPAFGPASPVGDLAGLEASLRKLGNLTVFAFASGEFMLIGRNGERVRDYSLVSALQKMLQWQGFEAISPEDMNCAT